MAKCLKCGSENLTANKNGFSAGKAVAGGLLLGALVGPISLLTGCIGSKNIKITCLDCGFSWTLKQ